MLSSLSCETVVPVTASRYRSVKAGANMQKVPTINRFVRQSFIEFLILLFYGITMSHTSRETAMRIVVAVLLTLCTAYASAQSFGSFIGDVVTKWNGDGRTMTLVEPFAYLDPSGVRWDAPKGATVDGASIPQFAWSIIGGPFEGKYRASSVIHDVACVDKKRPWESVHQTFYTGMLTSGVSATKAKVMYAAVYHFGPRWPVKQEIRQITSQIDEQRSCINVGTGGPVCVTVPITPQPVEAIIKIDFPPPPQTLSRAAFDQLQREIENKEATETPVSLNQIREYR